MERLTYSSGKAWEIKGTDGTPCDEVCEKRLLSGCHDCPIQMAFNRLAAYEDAMPLERVQELAQAEKDGRLVVLPSMQDLLKCCPMRVCDNGNCSPMGGFCQPGTEICKALHAAYEYGVFNARREVVAALKKREEADNETD